MYHTLNRINNVVLYLKLRLGSFAAAWLTKKNGVALEMSKEVIRRGFRVSTKVSTVPSFRMVYSFSRFSNLRGEYLGL